jgi:plasmid stability protein
MRQVTLRLPEALSQRLKQAAAERGDSVNAYASAVLSAAVDPDLAGDEAARVRERLARAGLLAPAPPRAAKRPGDAAVRRARRAAGSGRPLSDLVREGRG